MWGAAKAKQDATGFGLHCLVLPICGQLHHHDQFDQDVAMPAGGLKRN